MTKEAMCPAPFKDYGFVRRKTKTGRALHCCCVCGKLSVWEKGWEWFGSYKQLEDCEAVMKFCSRRCKARSEGVTPEMILAAREKEWRLPSPVYVPRSYRTAIDEQRAKRDEP